MLRSRGITGLVDLGSGGGFPGLTLAAALPARRALLIDSIGKKVRFLTAAIAAIGLADRVVAESVRAEALAADRRDREGWQAVTARAVAPLADLLELGLPLLRPGGVLVAWKRGAAEDPAGLGAELEAAVRALAAIDRAGRIEVVAPIDLAAAARSTPLAALLDHRLVVVERGTGAIAGGWPRDAAVRRRMPW